MPRPNAPLLAALAVLAVLGLVGCGGGGDAATVRAAPSASTPAATTPSARPAAGACVARAEPGGGTPVPCPTPTTVAGKANSVTFTTSEGSFTVALDVARAPATANSVAYLAKRGFYDGLRFHRVVPGFVIQGGDPLGATQAAGTGGPGYQVTEAPPSDLRYTRGVVAMAKGGTDPPGASGSQFFVVSASDVGLPPEYALVGRVSRGLATVEAITALGTGDGPPRRPVRILRARFAAR